MISLRATRNRMSFTRQPSINFPKFLTIKNYHTATVNKKSVLKFSCYLNSRYNPKSNLNLKHSILRISYFSTTFKEICRENSTLVDLNKVPLNTVRCIYTEHPDVANRSQEEIKKFYKLKNISIKGNDIPKPIMKFNELCLPENLMKVLEQENFPEPTPIQSQGWPVALSSRDMVGVSQTGSGKTLAYMLPAIVHATNKSISNQRTNKISAHTPKILVLGPTRELVQQIHQVSKHFMQASKIFGACAYGGASKLVQLRNLTGAEICIATPGRLLDFLESGVVSLKECSYLVLDEADRMLDMGFEPQIRDIVDQIPCDRQTLMWSATWPKEIRSLAEDYLNDYIHITIGSTDLVANPNIQQNIYIMKEEEKVDRLLSFLRGILENERCKVLIFAQTKIKVDFLSRLLKEKRIPAWGIHGGCSQRQRDDVLDRFRRTKPSVLIATDVASRGLDISDIQHIVNYDFPPNIEDYIHRIGRTARGSACGEAHSFFTSENTGILRDLVTVLKQANQPIDPELFKLPVASASKPFFKPQRRYFDNRSYGNRRMYDNGNRRMYDRRM